jgi:hypothetical protein
MLFVYRTYLRSANWYKRPDCSGTLACIKLVAFRSLTPGIWIFCDVDVQEAKMADGTNWEEQAAAEFARRWIAAVQAMGTQIQRQQETF